MASTNKELDATNLVGDILWQDLVARGCLNLDLDLAVVRHAVWVALTTDARDLFD
jgi:hypothetical protein